MSGVQNYLIKLRKYLKHIMAKKPCGNCPHNKCSRCPVKSKKLVYITLADGRVFTVKAHDIAHNRASYYDETDEDTSYAEEYEFTINDRYELTDWLFNQMDWYELNPQLVEHELKELHECEVVETKVI